MIAVPVAVKWPRGTRLLGSVGIIVGQGVWSRLASLQGSMTESHGLRRPTWMRRGSHAWKGRASTIDSTANDGDGVRRSNSSCPFGLSLSSSPAKPEAQLHLSKGAATDRGENGHGTARNRHDRSNVGVGSQRVAVRCSRWWGDRLDERSPKSRTRGVTRRRGCKTGSAQHGSRRAGVPREEERGIGSKKN
jgi:hypothetical protein